MMNDSQAAEKELELEDYGPSDRRSKTALKFNDGLTVRDCCCCGPNFT